MLLSMNCKIDGVNNHFSNGIIIAAETALIWI